MEGNNYRLRDVILHQSQRGGACGNWQHANGDASKKRHEPLAKVLYRFASRTALYDFFTLEELEALLDDLHKRRKDARRAARAVAVDADDSSDSDRDEGAEDYDCNYDD